MAKINWDGATLLAPVPVVMVSCGDAENSNIITIAWTGIINSNPAMTYVSIRPERHSYDIIKKSGEFTINLVNRDLTRRCDFCGVKSGKNIDKFKECHLTKNDGVKVKCPSIAESPLSLECKVKKIIPLGSHDMFLAEIVNVCVDENILTKSGKLDLKNADLVSYAHGEYFPLAPKAIGKFGYSVKKR